MTDQYRTRQGQHDYRDRYGSRDRQAEQFDDGSNWQQGETAREQRWQAGDDFDRGYGRDDDTQRGGLSRGNVGYRGNSSSNGYNRQTPTQYGRNEGGQGSRSGGGFDSFDQGRGGMGYGQHRSGSDSYGAGASGSGAIIPPRQYDQDDRGFFDRASDEVMSWFGDDDAARRRKMDSREDHRGRGPANYTRSNERLLEDACERLTRDPHIDASKIDVTCVDNEVTLTGTVDSRSAKRRAEDIVDDISGVKHVQNNLRVQGTQTYYGDTKTGSLTEN